MTILSRRGPCSRLDFNLSLQWASGRFIRVTVVEAGAARIHWSHVEYVGMELLALGGSRVGAVIRIEEPQLGSA